MTYENEPVKPNLRRPRSHTANQNAALLQQFDDLFAPFQPFAQADLDDEEAYEEKEIDALVVFMIERGIVS